MNGTDISGSFSYQSVVPDELPSDTDSVTGPYMGELMVTAADNSSMRMVAVDEFNVPLDLNGDGGRRFHPDDVCDPRIRRFYLLVIRS